MAARADRGVHHRGDRLRQERGAPTTTSSGAPDERRQLTVLKNALTMAAPADPKEAAELTQLVASMEGDVRPRQVLPGRRDLGGGVPRHRGDHRDPRQGPQSRAAARGLGRVALDLAADEEELRAVRRAVEQGRARAGIRRHRRDVALEVRHGARRVREGARSAVGAAAAALPLAAHLRPRASCARSTATSCPPTARFPRTCSATSGRRTGRNIYDIVGPASTPRDVLADRRSCSRGRSRRSR